MDRKILIDLLDDFAFGSHNIEQTADRITELYKQNQALQLQQTGVMLRLQYKLNEYENKKDNAKAICDKQVGIDVSFEAEVEDELLLLAERQFEAVLDVVDYVLNAT